MKPQTLLEFGKWLLNLALALTVAGIVTPMVSGQRYSYTLLKVFVILIIGLCVAGIILLERGGKNE